MIRLETPRLLLRAPTLADRDAYLALNTDPRILRYVGTVLPPDPAGVGAWIEALSDRFPEASPRGVWAAEHAGRFVGSFMLRPAKDTGEPELGYRLLPAFWGKGLATEACRAMLALVHGERVVARAHRDNAASRRVMERLGMRLAREYEWEGKPSVEYAISL